MSIRDELIEAYYYRRANNHPTIHTNRWPSWSELTDGHKADLAQDFDSLVHVLTAQGLQIVPVEPTEEMVDAGIKSDESIENTSPAFRNMTSYKAMLAAAPDPLAEADGEFG